MNNGVTWASGIGLGAGLMYLLDPERGRRRRSLLRDQCAHAWHTTGDAMGILATDLSHRAQGVVAETRSRFRHEEVADATLVERVRAKTGRVVSHPRAIVVTARNGLITLSGPILAEELEEFLATVRSVGGVTDIENRLEVHQNADKHPALQGGRPRPGEAAANWSPTARLLAGTVGSALAVYGTKRRGTFGTTLGTVGIGLLARGLTNKEMTRLVGVDGGRRAVDFQKTINIDAPVDSVFEFWTAYENFPRFMTHIRKVSDLGAGRSRWIVDGPAGVPVEWDAVITELVPNRLLAWESVPGAAIRNAGIIHFDPNRDGTTRVDIKLSYNPPAGAMGHAVSDLFGADPRRMMDDDLARMKTLIETGNPPHDAAERSTPTPAA
jgi:uncharacterized membrane protein